MKIVKITCPNCEKFTKIDLDNFRWNVKYLGGINPGDHFFEMPGNIYCQDCFSAAFWDVEDSL